jgi:histidyl-tRNA synthetase
MIQALRGMKDILGIDSQKYLYFIQNCEKIAKKYDFNYIETPLLEETSLFKRSVGNSSDIVNKEMYQFIDKGQNDICLRPEGTAGVVRSFVQNKFDKAGGIYKYYYYGSMFRYERPQQGRLRQFHQFGCESFGLDSVYEDANVIFMIKDILDFFNIEYTLKLNSLGCQECMPKFKEDLKSKLIEKKDTLCKDCHTRIDTNVIRVLDCKNNSCQEQLEGMPRITDCLCQSCNSDFEKLKEILSSNGMKYEVDSSLVRGLDYYNKTAFEFVSNQIGAQSAIAGGGRYDKLVSFLDGSSTSAIGFAIGVERVLPLVNMPKIEKDGIYFGTMVEKGIDICFKLYLEYKNIEINGEKLSSYMDFNSKNFKKHLKNCDKFNKKYCILIGENEIVDNTVWIKNLETKEEKIISYKLLGDYLSNN